MASQVIGLNAPSGLATPTIRVFADGSDTQAAGSPFTLVEATNRKGYYEAAFTGTLAGLFQCILYAGASPIGWGWATMTNTSATFLVSQDQSVQAVVGAVGGLPSIPSNWITAAGIAAAALNGKGDWLLSSGYTAPNNAGIASIVAKLPVNNIADETLVINATTAILAAVGSPMQATSGERNSIATALLDMANGIENSVTLRQAVRAIAAMLAGNVSGGQTAAEVFQALGNPGTTRVTNAGDALGNRTITTNL